MVTLPVHVALVPDGNRRWAKEHHLPSIEGHRRGYQRIQEITRSARELGIKILTLWAFSTENWKRAHEEVSYLMGLFERMIDEHLQESLTTQTRIIHLGRKDRLPEKLREKIQYAEQETAPLSKHYLCIGIDYGGEDELLRAIGRCQRGQSPPTLDELYTQLDTSLLPQQTVDLVVRTSGEIRTSGLMLLQSAYAEYVFSEKLFPDFTVADFSAAVHTYGERQRRFGT